MFTSCCLSSCSLALSRRSSSRRAFSFICLLFSSSDLSHSSLIFSCSNWWSFTVSFSPVIKTLLRTFCGMLKRIMLENKKKNTCFSLHIYKMLSCYSPISFSSEVLLFLYLHCSSFSRISIISLSFFIISSSSDVMLAVP